MQNKATAWLQANQESFVAFGQAFKAADWQGRFRLLADSSGLDNTILLLIMLNTYTLYLATSGAEFPLIEAMILVAFTIEAGIKIRAYSPSGYWADPWNKFDLALVLLGWILFSQIFESEAIGCLRVLRLLRVIRIIPMLRNVAEGLGRSIADTVGVFVIAFFLLMVCSLMVTLTFQSHMPEFSSVGTSFVTLLTMIFFDRLDLVGAAWAYSWYGTLIVFFIFYAGVSLMTINLLIGVFSSAMQKADPYIEKIYQTVKLIYTILLELKWIILDWRREQQEHNAEVLRRLDAIEKAQKSLSQGENK